jgi:hypothetical protein
MVFNNDDIHLIGFCGKNGSNTAKSFEELRYRIIGILSV